jgi:[ribosomal protein S18]-alanine N-acetyltransferase
MRPAVRPASRAHARLMAALHAAAFPRGEAWSAGAFAAQLAQPATFALLADEAGLVVARIAADEAEVLTLAVIPEARRRGIGKALLREAMRIAGDRRARTMYLEASANNAAALALYAASGFRPVGRRGGYYADGADAIVLAASLSPCAAAPG